MNRTRILAVVVAALALTFTLPAAAQDQDRIESAEKAVALMKLQDDTITSWFTKAAGYAVFPNVGKGGIGIGGAHGKGVGGTELTQVTVGFQFGGQSFVEVIFFEDAIALGNFKKGNFELSAQASAVAVTLGAGASTGYEKGVAIFTMQKGGLMYEATVGGQKFKYKTW